MLRASRIKYGGVNSLLRSLAIFNCDILSEVEHIKKGKGGVDGEQAMVEGWGLSSLTAVHARLRPCSYQLYCPNPTGLSEELQL